MTLRIKTRGSCRGLKGALPPADLLRNLVAGGTPPQSSSPFEKGGRTPTLNFNSGALPQTPHSPCGRRGKLFAFPSARECVAPLRQGTGSIFSGEKISTLKPLTAFSLFSELKKVSKNVEFYRRLSESRAKPLLFLGEAGGAGGKAPCKD